MQTRIRSRILIYGAVIAVALAVWLQTPRRFRPRVYSVASGKVRAYLAKRDRYKVIFVGDSRTYTDIQPRVIGPLLNRPSYNLASFGLWMPVQYMEFQDVFPRVPAGAVVVWSLSHRNFMPIAERWWIPGQYKFGLADTIEFIGDGYPVRRVFQEFEESPYSPFDIAVRLRKEFLARLDRVIWRARKPAARAAPPVFMIPAAQVKPSRREVNEAEAAKLIDALQRDRTVNWVAPVATDGIVTSVESTTTEGGYDRYLIDRELIKKQQAAVLPEDGTGCGFAANPVYMRTFGKILDLISRNHLRVIVNYIEDAPGSWSSGANRRCAKQFMLDKIVPLLSARGVEFIAPDFYPRINSSDDYYFDNAHLNTEGAAIYSELLATEIAKVLARKGW